MFVAHRTNSMELPYGSGMFVATAGGEANVGIMPAKMKAVTIEKHGGPDVLKFTEIPTPNVRPNEVLVEIKACGLNHLDIWARKGLPGVKIPLPHILGNDIAGIVRDKGELAGWVNTGDEVMIQPGISCGHCFECLSGNDNLCPEYDIVGYRRDGGYAEFVSVPAVNVIKKPASLSWEEAASLPLVTITCWHMLVTRAQTKPGDFVLIHAAGSGVGSIAIQVARLLGATVITTASTDEKLDRARKLGAHHTINYTNEEWPKLVRSITSGRGVDVVIEHTGARTWPGSTASLSKNGRLVTCGATTGYDASIDLRHLFYRHLNLLGSFMGSKAELIQAMKFIENGSIKAVVDRIFPLQEASRAHELMENRLQFGKIVLTPT
jgi:NADPH:quinone reductase-like Zn-dependent oxidoreductase